jgi:small-conductance mechanosensitive channel
VDSLIAELSRWFAQPLAPGMARKLALSAAIVLLFWLARTLLVRTLSRRTDDVTTLYRARKLTLYLSAGLVALLLAVVWVEQMRSMATFLGLVSAGLAIALSGLVTSIAGWVFLLVRRPFELGDRIEIGGHAGDVIDIRLFKFTLMEIGNWVDADQSTGRVIHVPNSQVITDVVINYTRGFRYIWNEIPVLVTFESDWEKAKALLQEIADRHAGEVVGEAERSVREAARTFLIFYRQLTPTVYTSVKDSGVLLTIRHLSDPRRRRGLTQAIWEDVLRAFAAAPDIDLAYPTQRFYRNRDEGKPALRPPEAAEPSVGAGDGEDSGE